MSTIHLTGTVWRATPGERWADAPLIIELAESFTLADGGVAPAGKWRATANAQGDVDEPLLVPETGTAHYRAYIPVEQPDGKAKWRVYSAHLAAADQPTLGALHLGAYGEPESVETVAALINAQTLGAHADVDTGSATGGAALLYDPDSAMWRPGAAGLSEAEVEGLAATAAAEVGALLSRALPSGRVLHVGAGRDHATLSAAYAALAALSGGEALSSANRYRLHLWGDIVETAAVTALDHVDLIFEAGARLIVDVAAGGAGLIAKGVTVTFAAREIGNAWIIRRAGGAINIVNAIDTEGLGIPGARLTLRGLNIETEGLTSGGNIYVVQARDVTFIDCVVRCGATSASTRARAGYGGRNVIAKRTVFDSRAAQYVSGANHGFIFLDANTEFMRFEGCEFYGGAGAASQGWTPGLSMSAVGRVEFYRSTFYGGAGYNSVGLLVPNSTTSDVFVTECGAYGGGGSECYGIWAAALTDRVRLTRCIGVGGPSGINSHGIMCHKSNTTTLDHCTGIGGAVGGAGLMINTQPNNYARHFIIGGLFMGRGTTPQGTVVGTASGSPGLYHGGSPFREIISGATFVGSPFCASPGVALGELYHDPNGYDWEHGLRFDNCQIYGGGLGSIGQGAPTYYADSPAVLFFNLAIAGTTFKGKHEFINCTLRSNALSPAILVDGDASPWPIRFVGGYAASLDPATQPAIRAPLATPWADAEIYDMTLVGGVENVTVAAAPPTLGTNRVL